MISLNTCCREIYPPIKCFGGQAGTNGTDGAGGQVAQGRGEQLQNEAEH